MHIVHVTPHLPPDQAANALLPWQLGEWGREAGDTVEYVAHPPRAQTADPVRLAGHATWIPRRAGSFADRGLRLGSLTGGYRIWRATAGPFERADLVHVHSNGLLPELAVLLARRAGKPVILTLYGTEIWHYRRRRLPPDLFTRAYHAASAVTFYSARLLGRAREVGLTRQDLHVVYPPVPAMFAVHDEAAQADVRAELRVSNRHLLLNVKRLHPLAGQRYLLEAMTDVIRTHPDTRLVICGAGALLNDLKGVARSAGVERHVTFAGLLDNATIARYCAAADLFVLPSLLEALPTVAVEALACGTPVLSSDNPGGLELNDLFGPDVSTVPREQPIPLGAAITNFLDAKRRTLPSTREIIERTFRPEAVSAQYRAIYQQVRAGGGRMTSRLGAAASAALLGALSSVIFLAAFYLASPALRIDFAVDPPRLVTGVHPGERDDSTGLTFAWTGRDLAIRLPGLDRRVAWSIDMRVRGGRQHQPDNPVLVIFVDGARVVDHRSETEFTTVRVPIPPRPARPRGALITMQSSSTFVPGSNDPRALGVMLDVIVVSPEGFALPPWAAFTGAAAAGAVLGAAIGLVGVAPGLAIGGVVLLAAAQSALIARGFGPFSNFPEVATRVATAIGAGLVLITLAIEALRRQPLHNTARFAAVFSASVLFVKLLVQFHPDMPVGDALFQAHRFQEVLRGNYYFTSIAPGNYSFPYAPGLYLAASPFADFVRREAGDVVLLRTVVAVTDAVLGALLYLVVARGWADRRAAAFATALYQLLPLDFLIASGGTLTSAFAQSLAVGAFAVVSAPWLRVERPASVVVLLLAFLAAFLSHTSTFAVLSVTAAVVAMIVFWRGGPARRSHGVAVISAGAAATILAVLVYYMHFMDTYRTELSRIGAETTAAAADAGGRSIAFRAWIVPWYMTIYYGVPSLLLAAVGTREVWRRGMRDPLTLTLAGWALTCTLFLLVGVLTPVDMRYYVAALPAVAIIAAAGASHWWATSRAGRVATIALLAWAAWIGIGTWIGVLR